ncbi:MAG: HD domain-containing phosphohydrolase [Pseudomonadota bacterium]
MPSIVGTAAHPQALDAIVQASARCAIIASQDIVDARGTRLWPRGQPVSPALAHSLHAHKLAQPLEVCLDARDGVTLFTLCTELRGLLEGSGAASQLLGAHADMLLHEVKQLDLHPVAQLLLTTAAATRPQSLSHAVLAMALAGALAASRELNWLGSGRATVRLAMLGGLLHDLGEVYLPPEHLGPTGPQGLAGHQQLMQHPRLAQRLLDATTDYPRLLTQAIGEHHERLDGSGYPARLLDPHLGALGKLLAVVEVATTVLGRHTAPASRLRLALQVVPGEFDTTCTDLLAHMARSLPESLPKGLPMARPHLPVWNGLAARLARTRELAAAVRAQRRSDTALLDIVRHAVKRLETLHAAWEALGLWQQAGQALLPRTLFELNLAEEALAERVQALQRECLLMSTPLRVVEKLQLAPLWQGLMDDRPGA